ncbi:MAG: DUF3300 domain-containing protein [Terracidiphilus sp.]
MKLAGFRHLLFIAFVPLMALCVPRSALAQPAPLAPPQLDQLVARIALYPDPLLAQILTASTYWTEIPEAASWADQHSYLKGDALASAIQADHLQWDPSVLGLLPFPSVLHMMAQDQAWTEQLGNAVLNQRPEVMDAVQRMRRLARQYGYLAPNGYVNVVDSGGYIEVLPLNPAMIYVPWYDPYVVFAPPPSRRRRDDCDSLRPRHYDWSNLRDVGLVDWFGIRVAGPHDPHRPPSVGPGVGEPVWLCAPLCPSVGAFDWTARRSPSVEKVTACSRPA